MPLSLEWPRLVLFSCLLALLICVLVLVLLSAWLLSNILCSGKLLSHFLSEWLLVEFSLCLLLFLLVVYFPPGLAHHRTIPAPLSQQMSKLAVGWLPMTLCMGQKYLQSIWRSSFLLSTPATPLRSFSRMSFYVFVVLSVYRGIASSYARLLASRAPILSSCILAYSCRAKQLHLDCFVQPNVH